MVADHPGAPKGEIETKWRLKAVPVSLCFRWGIQCQVLFLWNIFLSTGKCLNLPYWEKAVLYCLVLTYAYPLVIKYNTEESNMTLFYNQICCVRGREFGKNYLTFRLSLLYKILLTGAPNVNASHRKARYLRLLRNNWMHLLLMSLRFISLALQNLRVRFLRQS